MSWQLQAGLPSDRTEVVNMRELSADDATAAVLNDTWIRIYLPMAR